MSLNNFLLDRVWVCELLIININGSFTLLHIVLKMELFNERMADEQKTFRIDPSSWI